MSKKQIEKPGRTYHTSDEYLPHKNDNAYKDVNVVSLEYDKNGNMLVVRLTKEETKNTSKLKHHTYKRFKHFAEIEDNEGNPIKKGKKFKENSQDYDLTQKQVDYIEDIIYNHSKQSQTNREKREDFRKGNFKNKKSRD